MSCNIKVANTIEFHPEIRGTAFPPRPSCHIRPVSEGRGRCKSSPRRRRSRRAAPRPPPGGLPEPQSAAARRLGPEGAAGEATGRAKSHELLRRISEDFGSEKLGVWLPTESHTGIGNMSQISQPKNSLNWIGKSQLRTYNNLLNLQAYPFSGVRHLRRLAPGSGGPPAASVGQLRRCLLSQPAGCLRLKAETLDVWQCKVYS